MSQSPPLGDQELEALRYISDQGPISVGAMAKEFGVPRGLARTTVLTVMERLRKKGYLTRKQEGGVFRYSPKKDSGEVLANVVAQFVERSLGGSLTPFVAYLADMGRLSPGELDELRRMVESLEDKGK